MYEIETQTAFIGASILRYVLSLDIATVNMVSSSFPVGLENILTVTS